MEKAQFNLIGKWQVRRQFNVDATGERNLKSFSDQECIVEFAGDGNFTVLLAGSESTAAYSFDSASKTLRIRQSEDSQASPIAGSDDTTYRVIPLNDREMYFQKPHSVEVSLPNIEFETFLLERI